jgi:hypothetical protein
MKPDYLFAGFAALLIVGPSLLLYWEPLLRWLFPPKMGYINTRMTYRASGVFSDEDLGDGIVWRGYDVRATGIEKHFWRISR